MTVLSLLALVVPACDRSSGTSGQASAKPPKEAAPQETIQLPEYYGIYAVDRGKTIELKPGTRPDLSPKAEFIVFHKAVTVALGLGESIKLRQAGLTRWDPSWNSIDCRMKPVEGRNEMVRLVPARDLTPGAYELAAHENVEFYVQQACYEKLRGALDNLRRLDHAAAIRDLDEAIRLEPEYAAGYRMRAVAYRQKGDYDRAIRDFDEAIRLKPDYAEAYGARGEAYRQKGDYDRAIRDLDEAIRLKPDYAWAYGARRVLKDAETGELFEFEFGFTLDTPPYPHENPKTHKKTLYPTEICYWDQCGKKGGTRVILNGWLGKGGTTNCPVCGHIVQVHNPAPPDWKGVE